MARTTSSQPIFPFEVMKKIVCHASEGGPRAVQNLVKCGRAGRDAVMSPECLKRIRLDKTYHFPKCAKPTSKYFSLFCKCLKEKNPYALYAVALRLAFKHGELDAALYILRDLKVLYPHAKLLYLVLNYCAGYNCDDITKECRLQFKEYEVRHMGSDLDSQIKITGPRRQNSYFPTFHVEDAPQCGEIHEWFGEYEDERCEECMFFYLARDICKLS